MKPNMKEATNRDVVNIKYEKQRVEFKKIVDNKKYYVRTYGCQMNTHDSEEIKYYLESLGFLETKVLEEADVVVLNTCAIRENAKEKLFGFLSRSKFIKENVNKNLIIALCGCLMQVEDETDFVELKHKYVDIVVGTHNIIDLPLYVEKKYKNIKNNIENSQNINVHSNSDLVYTSPSYSRDSKISAWVNITYGCDNFCTFCIVPYTRGRERSRTKEDILNEVIKLKENGYKGITLLGQNVNSYGKSFKDGYRFPNLLEDVAKVGVERIRFVTSNPWNFSDDLINVVKTYDNIMPYIHLPVQSGSNNILKRMNRRYTKESYLELFDKIKNSVPNVSVTTDIIVGFPGESDEDFNDTMDLVNRCKFDGAFTFIYSKRSGTAASLMEDAITLEEKENRLYKLNDLVNSYSLLNNKKLVGKTVKVLVEGVSDKDKNKVYGHTDTMKTVNLIGSSDLVGNIVNVEITSAKSFNLEGKYIN